MSRFLLVYEVRKCLTPNYDYKTILGYPSCNFLVNPNRLKKFATLLPNNWLAGTPQALALMRLGIQSAEKAWISGIDWNNSDE
ncbi:hypothetical protein [Peribacillus sp. NPDC055009]